MPYLWNDTAPDDSGAVCHQLDLWPHHSLSVRGFVWVIGLTAAALALPLIAVLGTSVLWGLLPFALAVVAALWGAIRRSYRSPAERLILSTDRLQVIRSDPGRPDRIWNTNPYWVRLQLRRDGPVDSYLILTDGRRDIELGAFLSPQERIDLKHDLERRLGALRDRRA